MDVSKPKDRKIIQNNPGQAKQAIQKAKKIILLISGPDEDSICAGIVLKRYLQKLDKEANLVSGKPFSSFYELPLIHEIEYISPSLISFDQYDLIIILDTANPDPQIVDSKIYPSFKFPENKLVLSIDHHRGNEGYADYNIWEPDSSSTCEVIFTNFPLEKTLTSDEATLLLLGISSDTGHFRWATNGQTLINSAKLIQQGGDIDFVVQRLYYNYDKETITLIQDWLERVQYNKSLGYMSVTITERYLRDQKISSETFKRARTVFQHMFLRSVTGYPLGFFFVESDQFVKAQLFGNGYYNDIDLTELSLLVGGNGGGHFNASGFIIEASGKEAVRRINKVLVEIKSKYKKSKI